MSTTMEAETASTVKALNNQSTPTTTAGSTSAAAAKATADSKSHKGKNLDARSWLENLSAEECAAAMSFRDGPLFSSFLHLAAAASSSSHQQQPPQRVSVMAALTKTQTFEVKDLNMSVDKKEWEATLARFESEFQAPPKASPPPPPSPMNSTTKTPVATSTPCPEAPSKAAMVTPPPSESHEPAAAAEKPVPTESSSLESTEAVKPDEKELQGNTEITQGPSHQTPKKIVTPTTPSPTTPTSTASVTPSATTIPTSTPASILTSTSTTKVTTTTTTHTTETAPATATANITSTDAAAAATPTKLTSPDESVSEEPAKEEADVFRIRSSSSDDATPNEKGEEKGEAVGTTPATSDSMNCGNTTDVPGPDQTENGTTKAPTLDDASTAPSAKKATPPTVVVTPDDKPSEASKNEGAENVKESTDTATSTAAPAAADSIKTNTPPSIEKDSGSTATATTRNDNKPAKRDEKKKEGTMTKVSPEVSASAHDIADNVCIIFPSVATHDDDGVFTGSNANDQSAVDESSSSSYVPYVSLNPVFVKEKGTVVCIQTLDNILKAAVNPTGSFLSSEFWSTEQTTDEGNSNNNNSEEEDQSSTAVNEVEKLCLRRLQSLMSAAAGEKAPILLFLILLVRMEVAAYLAFRAAQLDGSPDKHAGKSPGNKRRGKGKRSGAGNNKLKTGEESSQQGSPEAAEGFNCAPEIASRLESKKLTELVDKLDMISRIPKTLDASKLNDAVSPLLNAGFCWADSSSMKVSDIQSQNLIFTPLPLVVQLMSSLQAEDQLAFQRWDKAWSATIQCARDLAPAPSIDTSQTGTSADPSATTPAAESQANGFVWTAPNNPPTLAPTPTSTAKKNKKKRTKRKKRKNSNAGSNAPATNASDEKEDQPASAEGAETIDEEPMTPDGGDDTPTTVAPAVDLEVALVADSEPTAKSESVSVENEQLKTETTDKNDDQAATPTDDAGPSYQAETLPASTSDETDTEVVEKEEVVDAETKTDKSDISVSRVHGVGTVVVAPSTADPSEVTGNNKAEQEGTPKEESPGTTEDLHDDTWETVEVKGRGNRKKSGRSSGHHHHHGSGHGNKKSKSRTAESRRRVKTNKMVKIILNSVLDSVDDIVERRQQGAVNETKKKGSTDSRNATGPPAPTPPVAWKDGNRGAGLPKGSKDTTMRDVVLGRQATPTHNKKNSRHHQRGDSKNGARNANVPPTPPPTRQKDKNLAAKGGKPQGAGADQNTATTVPETVSAVSDVRRTQPSADRDIARSDSSADETNENRKADPASIPSNVGKISSPAPPLPTLLNPGNTNSSSSSVASSLEAPHASHGHRHTSSSNEIEVGYHLLDVCDRLTRDMHVFMSRRAAALSNRRRERGALLGALQDSVSSIWSGHSHVELYGSCATMLDLPSSDLDVVVCGLDHIDATMSASPSSQLKSMGSFSSDNMTPDKMNAESQLPLPHHGMPYVPHLNAERVMRLAADLERQPWAVHVKAIPTASVPVVKVLADPSRLPGSVSANGVEGDEWMQQQQGATPSDAPPSSSASQASVPQFEPSMVPPVWRGADVINGLLKLDITFEGPEHGGIGSTEFSARVVQNVCDETGLVPEGTAFVQVIMVVKELLAQRRLNEPFSGGLSSYALLLLVLSVMCERKVIREELDRVERQRRVVEAGGGSSEFSDPPQSDFDHEKLHSQAEGEGNVRASVGSVATETSTKGGKQKGKGSAKAKTDKSENAGAKTQGTAHGQKTASKQSGQQRGGRGKGAGKGNQAPPAGANTGSSDNGKQSKAGSNSWACIAKGKNEAPPSKTDSDGKKEEPKQKNKAPASFADAVARNAAKNATQGKPSNTGSSTAPNASDAKLPPKANVKQLKDKDNGRSNSNKASAENGPSKANEASSNDQNETGRKIEADEKTSKFNNYSSEPADPTISSNQSVFPHGFNDVIEVLCSGETTPGKLLMHFLLFYGQHFDAHATAIDISGKHPRDFASSPPYHHLSPYIQRRSAGNIDPVTGMLTVDPIVVYDPLEGAEHNNVARRCFLWGSVKWVFAQSYMTLSSAVERNATPPGTPGEGTKNTAAINGSTSTRDANNNEHSAESAAWSGPYNPNDKGNIFDPSSPLLELLLSF